MALLFLVKKCALLCSYPKNENSMRKILISFECLPHLCPKSPFYISAYLAMKSAVRMYMIQ